jgi:hypothetical protein
MFHFRQAAGLPLSRSSVRLSSKHSCVLWQRAAQLLVGVAIAGLALSASACSEQSRLTLHTVSGLLVQLPLW